MPWVHPDFVLAAAVRAGVLTAAKAGLIGRNRLEGIPLSRIARETGIKHSALCMRRKRAETRSPPLSGPGGSGSPDHRAPGEPLSGSAAERRAPRAIRSSARGP